MRNTPKFTIITPAYQAAAFIELRLTNTLAQAYPMDGFECIVVDDGSSDATWETLQRLSLQYLNLHVFHLPQNAGPGVARNVAISQAKGEWLVFVDSDDVLLPNALKSLSDWLDVHPDSELVGYNWAWFNSAQAPCRKDHVHLIKDRDSRLCAYLRLQMDGSLIFSAVKRSLLLQHKIQFASGLHEDVDVLFKLYWHAQKVGYLNDVIYLKDDRDQSIVNHISLRHLDGFLRAWEEIGHYIQLGSASGQLQRNYQTGLHAVVATRLRAILHNTTSGSVAPLYLALYKGVQNLLNTFDWLQPPDIAVEVNKDKTQYAQLTYIFWMTMQTHMDHPEEYEAILMEVLPEIIKKSWSCVDLHHSVFLGPDEIRTCCKRFFVDGEMRGDVVLKKIPQGQIVPVTPQGILKDKQTLLTKINQGVETACSGCPFLEFKEWAPLDTLKIKYLSFEYHSVCNLKCSYCSDTYYGGEQARYDVKGLVNKFLSQNMLNECHTIVWGGGEPVVGKDFAEMLARTVSALPNAKQRVLTNSIKHSSTVEKFLQSGQVSVTTSVDAGNKETFSNIRGMDSLNKVIRTLKKYATANADQVTIKYIFTEGNCSLDEVHAFVDMIESNQLLNCNFQISCDFKHETIASDAVIAMIALYGLLTDKDCRLVFFDDLLRQRLSETHAQAEPIIKSTLSTLGLGHIIADSHAYPKVAIWGAGWQSKYLIEKSSFFREVEVEYFIDSRASRIGERFMDHDIVGPEQLLKSEIPVVIAAVQNLPIIYQSFQQLGIDDKRLIKQLII